MTSPYFRSMKEQGKVIQIPSSEHNAMMSCVLFVPVESVGNLKACHKLAVSAQCKYRKWTRLIAYFSLKLWADDRSQTSKIRIELETRTISPT
jgi:hypothetical protein